MLYVEHNSNGPDVYILLQSIKIRYLSINNMKGC